MTKNAQGALYFVAFFVVLLLELKQFFVLLSPRWIIVELALYLLFGGVALVLIPLVYLNYPDMAGWLILLLAFNLVNMAFLFTLLPFSWSYLALFAFGFWGVVAGVPFQAHYHPPKKARIIYLPPKRIIPRGKARKATKNHQ